MHPSECLISYHDNHAEERIALVVLLLTSNGKVSLFLPSAINTSGGGYIIFTKREMYFSTSKRTMRSRPEAVVRLFVFASLRFRVFVVNQT